jgi:hypothetical protein
MIAEAAAQVTRILAWVRQGKGPQGQRSSTLPPTAAVRQTSASVAETGNAPFGAHTHSGVQAARPTAAFSRKRQSVAIGIVPALTG